MTKHKSTNRKKLYGGNSQNCPKRLVNENKRLLTLLRPAAYAVPAIHL